MSMGARDMVMATVMTVAMVKATGTRRMVTATVMTLMVVTVTPMRMASAVVVMAMGIRSTETAMDMVATVIRDMVMVTVTRSMAGDTVMGMTLLRLIMVTVTRSMVTTAVAAMVMVTTGMAMDTKNMVKAMGMVDMVPRKKEAMVILRMNASKGV